MESVFSLTGRFSDRTFKTLRKGGSAQHRETQLRKGFLLQQECGTSSPTWLARKSGPFHPFPRLSADRISREPYQQMKESSALSGALISPYPKPAHACDFVLPLPPQVQKRSIPEILRIKKGLIFSLFCHPRLSDWGERKGGCWVSTTISRRGKDAWHSESSGWDSLISPRALSVLEDHYF